MPLLFLDFEASSLESGSFPIEVGWAIEGEGEATEAHLIRPAPGWTSWSAAFERVHGITHARLLAEGRPCAEVAARVATVLGRPDLVVASDNAAYEAFWLERLMRAAFRPVPCTVHPAHAHYLEAAHTVPNVGLGREAAAALVAAVLEVDRLRPRARPDAQAMLWVLEEVRRRVEGEAPGA